MGAIGSNYDPVMPDPDSINSAEGPAVWLLPDPSPAEISYTIIWARGLRHTIDFASKGSSRVQLELR
jgi:hypothetical protein